MYDYQETNIYFLSGDYLTTLLPNGVYFVFLFAIFNLRFRFVNFVFGLLLCIVNVRADKSCLMEPVEHRAERGDFFFLPHFLPATPL